MPKKLYRRVDLWIEALKRGAPLKNIPNDLKSTDRFWDTIITKEVPLSNVAVEDMPVAAFEHILSKAAKSKDPFIMKKCWEIIPADQEMIKKFMKTLNTVVFEKIVGETFLQAATVTQQWDKVRILIDMNFQPDVGGLLNKTPLQLLFDGKLRNLETIANALSALYGNDWKKNKDLAKILIKEFTFKSLKHLYGEDWKNDKELALMFLTKFDSVLSFLNSTLTKDPDFWVQASRIGGSAVLRSIDKSYFDDKLFILQLISNLKSQYGEGWKEDLDLALIISGNDTQSIKEIADSVKMNENFWYQALRFDNFKYLLLSMPNELRQNKWFLTQMLQKGMKPSDYPGDSEETQSF